MNGLLMAKGRADLVGGMWALRNFALALVTVDKVKPQSSCKSPQFLANLAELPSGCFSSAGYPDVGTYTSLIGAVVELCTNCATIGDLDELAKTLQFVIGAEPSFPDVRRQLA